MTIFIPNDAWFCTSMDKDATMTLLPRLATICKEWRDIIRAQAEYAALRVAMWDLLQVKPCGLSRVGCPSGRKEMIYLTRKYELACAVFFRSWILDADLDPRLRTASMAELSIGDLLTIRSVVQDGWSVIEMQTCPGERVQSSPRVWITPSARIIDVPAAVRAPRTDVAPVATSID